MNTEKLTLLARTAATSERHWTRLFEALRESLPVDRICAAMRLDAYTAYLPLVAQNAEFEPYVGAAGLYADREVSLTFDVIEGGLPTRAAAEDWAAHPDLAFYSLVAKSNLKFPIALAGRPAVLNIWSAAPDAFTDADLRALAPIAAEISRSPFELRLEPVGLSLRKVKEIQAARQALSRAA